MFLIRSEDGVISVSSGRPFDPTSLIRPKHSHPYSYTGFYTWEAPGFKDVERQSKLVWTDRLYQWSPDKFNKCCKEHFGDESQYFERSSRPPKKIEGFLSAYFEKSVNLLAVAEHCNQASGFPVWTLHYEETP